MEEPKRYPDNYCNKSTEMSPNTAFGLKQVKHSDIIHKDSQFAEQDAPVAKISAAVQISPSIASPSMSSVDEKKSILETSSSQSHVVVEKPLDENLIKVEKSTSPFSDVMLDTGIGTESPFTADTASSPFLPDIQSPSSLSFQSSSVNMVKEHCSTQTIHVEMLSAHTRTPSSDNVEPDAVLELSHSQQEFHKSSVKDFLQEHMSDDTANLTETDDLPSLSRDTGTKDSSVAEEERRGRESPLSAHEADERLLTLHDQLLSEESALESSTDSGVDLKEASQSYTCYSIVDTSDASSLREDVEGPIQLKTENIVEKTIVSPLCFCNENRDAFG
ncbi:uncharacterized protein CEXT_286301 [Caerostris extrusa]|uniref:Uncharacterized protein n=1 Tax=Caerostris extrusa TaxID=172846 RepID=A0AAV4NTS2_CAEEX|nr:uncharacterized protein CEXT_286301 [Caerostris extrusa]